ncbi:MAG: hypothetical protein EXS49_01890 [Candidatus Pacebacteria bacterium]|nr:hypothetical protein [Candidatus Paceibacterota bacterium]
MKKIIKASIVFLVIGFFSFISINKSLGGTPGNVLGWIWSGSFNDLFNGCAFSPEECGNSGWGSLSSSNSYPGHDPNDPNNVTYGITVPNTDGPINGSLWLSNLGWINFQPTGGFPTSGCNPAPCPNHGIERNGNNLTGWAIVSSFADNDPLNGGGLDGWIKASGIADDGTSYGPVIDQVTQTINGKMWSGDLGWFDISATFSNPPCDPATDPLCPPPPPPPPGFNSNCSGTPNPAYISTGGNINWKASVISNGTPPYSYSWTFAPAPDSKTGSNDKITGKYSIPGLQKATVEITDSTGEITSSTCKVDMLKTGKVKEDIPLPL